MSDLFPSIDQAAPVEAAGELVVTLAVSLTQPWATLMELGEKLNETRSWPWNHRGWFAIHAAKGFPPDCRALVDEYPFDHALRRYGFRKPQDLPLGAVVAVTRLVECVRTERIVAGLSFKESSFGDYTRGRFAWRTAGVRRLKAPIPMRGKQGVWTMPQPITLADLR